MTYFLPFYYQNIMFWKWVKSFVNSNKMYTINYRSSKFSKNVFYRYSEGHTTDSIQGTKCEIRV